MLNDRPIFTVNTVNEVKSASITIKLTPRQKEWLCGIAEEKGLNVSQFMLGLVGKEYERIKREQSERRAKEFFGDD